MNDPRTKKEKEKGYPPSPVTMARKCTKVICGVLNESLFDMVNKQLFGFLQKPNLTVEEILSRFKDTSGSYRYPEISYPPGGRWLRNPKTLESLINTNIQHWIDIIRIPKIGPDSYYDMFRITLLKIIENNGKALGTFVDPEKKALNNIYFQIADLTTGERSYVKVKKGIPYKVEGSPPYKTIHYFQTVGAYEITDAFPREDFPEDNTDYSLLKLGNFSFKQTVDSDRIFQITYTDKNGLRVESDFYKVAIVEQKDMYSLNHYPWQKEDDPEFDGYKIKYVKQQDLENTFVRSDVCNDQVVAFSNIPKGKYKVLCYSEDDIVVATIRDVEINETSFVKLRFPHTFSLRKVKDNIGSNSNPPRKAFLKGDIIVQNQGSSNNCGTFSLANAISYWKPLRYNPKLKNGNWFEVEHGGLIGGTFQKEIMDAALNYHCNTVSYALCGGITKTQGLRKLKQWIAAGIPVIVEINEHHGGDGGEHYKVIVGYDDDAVLRYDKDNGSIGTTKGAFYFANSGMKTENVDLSSLPHILESKYREKHKDHNEVPIGNDVDSYDAFWNKWFIARSFLRDTNIIKAAWYHPIYPTRRKKGFKWP